jgi:hypothetical protein
VRHCESLLAAVENGNLKRAEKDDEEERSYEILNVRSLKTVRKVAACDQELSPAACSHAFRKPAAADKPYREMSPDWSGGMLVDVGQGRRILHFFFYIIAG